MEPAALSKQMEVSCTGEIVVTSIDSEGSMQDYDLALTKSVADAIDIPTIDIPTIASGGEGRLEDLRTGYCDGNGSALAAGSLFVYLGRKRAVLISNPTRAELEDIFEGIS